VHLGKYWLDEKVLLVWVDMEIPHILVEQNVFKITQEPQDLLGLLGTVERLLRIKATLYFVL